MIINIKSDERVAPKQNPMTLFLQQDGDSVCLSAVDYRDEHRPWILAKISPKGIRLIRCIDEQGWPLDENGALALVK